MDMSTNQPNHDKVQERQTTGQHEYEARFMGMGHIWAVESKVWDSP